MNIFCHAVAAAWSCRIFLPVLRCGILRGLFRMDPGEVLGAYGPSAWHVMDAPLATPEIISYLPGIHGGCCWGRNCSHLGNHTNCDHAWRLLGRKSSSTHFHSWFFFRRKLVGRFSAPKDTETGISNFQLTVYAECKDGTFHQIYTAAMLTSNSESYEEMLQWKTCRQKEIPFPQQPTLGGNNGQRQARYRKNPNNLDSD